VTYSYFVTEVLPFFYIFGILSATVSLFLCIETTNLSSREAGTVVALTWVLSPITLPITVLVGAAFALRFFGLGCRDLCRRVLPKKSAIPAARVVRS
jgi:hypothetical protein